jgi:hypothetical protein
MTMIAARKIRFWPVIGARCAGPTSTKEWGLWRRRVQRVSQHLVDVLCKSPTVDPDAVPTAARRIPV